MEQQLTFKVQRYNPTKDKAPYMQEFKVMHWHGMTVLDGLIYIKEHLDNSLSFRSSCRMGICGSCAVLVNNLPMLACHTPIEELESTKIVVRSLPNFPIIRDMVADLTPLFEKHKSVKPFVVSKTADELERPEISLSMSQEELEQFIQFSYCIKCGCCMAACPTMATDPLFLGPQPLAQAYRYCTDTRDQGDEGRFAVADQTHGVWLCHLAGACSEVCPKGLDPAFAVQLLKRTMATKGLGLRKQPKPAVPVGPITDKKPRIEPPAFTVKKA